MIACFFYSESQTTQMCSMRSGIWIVSEPTRSIRIVSAAFEATMFWMYCGMVALNTMF